MKTLIVAALMASAAFAAPASICDGQKKVSGTSTLAAIDSEAVGCTWAADTSVTTKDTSKSLTITGGSTEGSVTIDLADLTDPFRLEINGGLKVARGLTIKGALPKGSSVLVSKCAFESERRRTARQLDLRGLSVLASSVTVVDNTFLADFTNTGANRRAICVALGSTIEASDVVIRGNRADAVGGSSGRAVTLLILNADAEFLNSRVALTLNSARSNAVDVAITAADIAVKAPDAVSNPSPAVPDWSKVTDKQARETYGKSSFEIAGNVLDAAAGVEAWRITDNVGGDWTIKGNSARSATGGASGSYKLDAPYYGISVSVAGNKLQAPAAAKHSSITFDVAKVPSNSAVRADGNTLVSGETAGVAAFVLADETWLPSGSDFVIMGNVLAAADGLKVDLAGTEYVAEYQFSNTVGVTPGSGPVALCGNIAYGNWINTDALVAQTLMKNGVALPVVKVADCAAYRLRSAAPQRAAAAGALVSLAVASAALLVL